MPNTREKLMRLLCDALEDGCVGHCNYPHCFKVKNTADHLIANGVTLAEDNNVPSKWIPVTERLPEYEQQVLTYRGESGISIERMFPGAFWDFDYDIIDGVTHWMPLPEPPKGE